MNLIDSINECKTLLEQAEKETNSLMKGCKASAPRIRKSLQEIKKRIPLIRKHITVYLKDMPTKKRTPVDPSHL